MLALDSLIGDVVDALRDAALLGLSFGRSALGQWRLAVRRTPRDQKYEFFEGGVRVPRVASPARPGPDCLRARTAPLRAATGNGGVRNGDSDVTATAAGE